MLVGNIVIYREVLHHLKRKERKIMYLFIYPRDHLIFFCNPQLYGNMESTEDLFPTSANMEYLNDLVCIKKCKVYKY